MTAIAQELSQAVGIRQACQVLDVPRSRLYPRQQAAGSSCPRPAHAFSVEERTAIRTVLNSERFMDKTPRQIYAALLDVFLHEQLDTSAKFNQIISTH